MNEIKWTNNSPLLDPGINIIPISKDFREAINKGMAKELKKGKVKLLKFDLEWHDLKKNPDDLPKKYIGTVYDVCLDQNDNNVVYFHDSKTWFNLATGQKENVERWASMANIEIEQVN